jgi:hypothetical protein
VLRRGAGNRKSQALVQSSSTCIHAKDSKPKRLLFHVRTVDQSLHQDRTDTAPPRRSVHKNVSTAARPISSHTAIHPTHHRQGIILLLYRYSSFLPIHPFYEARRHRVRYDGHTRHAVVPQHFASSLSCIID